MSCCFGAKRQQKYRQIGNSSQESNKKQINQKTQINQIPINLGSSIIKTKVENGQNQPVENNQVNKPKLIESTQLMNFQIDDEDGITHTPSINTFRYQSLLSHGVFELPKSTDE